MFTVKDLLDAYCGTHHYNKVIFVEVGSIAPCEGSITYEEAMYKEYGQFGHRRVKIFDFYKNNMVIYIYKEWHLSPLTRLKKYDIMIVVKRGWGLWIKNLL